MQMRELITHYHHEYELHGKLRAHTLSTLNIVYNVLLPFKFNDAKSWQVLLEKVNTVPTALVLEKAIKATKGTYVIRHHIGNNIFNLRQKQVYYSVYRNKTCFLTPKDFVFL